MSVKDGIGERCIVNGLGNIALGGALGGAERFASAYTHGDANIPVKVELIDSDYAVIAWERVRCTYDGVLDQLVRDAVMASSNAGAPVDFGSSGAQRVFVFLPAEDVSTPADLTAALKLIDAKPSCIAAAKVNVNVSSPPATYDGISAANGDRILLRVQTAAAENGTYIFALVGISRSLTRTEDQFTTLASVEIEQGTTFARRKFVLTTTGEIEVGVTPTTWELIDDIADLADVAFTGEYADLLNAPTLGTAAATHASAYATAAQGTDDRTASGLRTATTVVFLSASAAPSAGQVPTATSPTTATWQTPAGGTPGGSDTQVQFNNAGAFAGATNVVYNSTLGTIGVSKSTWTNSYTPPGNLLSLIAQNGSDAGVQSKFSLYHAYWPFYQYDVYSLAVDPGYTGGVQCSIGFGVEYGVPNFLFKGMGLKFVNSGHSITENTYPAAASVWWRLPNATTSSFSIGISDLEDAVSFCGTNGLQVWTSYASVIMLQTSKTIGGTILKPRTAANVALTVQLAASQTANAFDIKNSAGSVLSSIKSDGSLQPASMADSAATNDSIYYSTTASKLVYKDAGGTVNALY